MISWCALPRWSRNSRRWTRSLLDWQDNFTAANERAEAAEAALAEAKQRWNQSELQLAGLMTQAAAMKERIAFLVAEAHGWQPRLAKAEAERDDYRFWNERVRVCEHHTQDVVAPVGDCLICNIDAAEASNERLREALSEYNIHRVLWKHTVDADLNTDEGCSQAAKAIVAYLAALAREDA